MTCIKLNFNSQLRSRWMPFSCCFFGSIDTSDKSNQCDVSTDSIQIKENVGLSSLLKTPIEVYPNPSRDVVYVNGLDGAEQVELINSKGQIIDVNLNDTIGLLEINIKHLNSGIYTMLIHSEKGIYFCKVVKN